MRAIAPGLLPCGDNDIARLRIRPTPARQYEPGHWLREQVGHIGVDLGGDILIELSHIGAGLRVGQGAVIPLRQHPCLGLIEGALADGYCVGVGLCLWGWRWIVTPRDAVFHGDLHGVSYGGWQGGEDIIAEDRAERLDVIPAQYRVLVTVRPKLGCRTCSDGVAQALAPKHIVPGGLPSERLIADVLVKKYADHLPLYRQSQIMARQGVIVDRATLANWVGAAAARLKPLVELLGSARLFVDETTVKVLAPGTGKTRTGYMWAMVRDDRPHGSSDPPTIVYNYMPGRGGIWAAKLLGDYRGILQVDGYEAYRQFGRPDRPGGPATLAYCWAHVRRGFFDAAKGDGTAIADEALRRISALYEIERDIAGQSPDARLAARRERSAPLVEAMHAWLEDKKRRMFSGSPTLVAINYALGHWAGLIRFLHDGRIDLDNNAVERSMRPIALQRKNALFAGHDLGAENWAAIASLIECCKLSGINPNTYLADVLIRIAGKRDAEPLDDLLPGNWACSHSGSDMFEYSTNPIAA